MRRLPDEMATRLMAAADLFAERGLDGTKTEDIVAATGIPKATLYYHFEGKEQVLSYIFGVVLDALGEAVQAALAGGGDPVARLRRLIGAHLGVFAAYPRASQALHFDLGRAARLPEVAARSSSAYVEPVADLLVEGMGTGAFRTLNPKLTAVAILGAISTAAIHLIAIDPFEPLDALADVVGSMVLGGVVAEGRS